MQEESFSITPVGGGKCKIRCNEPQKHDHIFGLVHTCGLSQPFIALLHSFANFRKLIINANGSYPYTFKLVMWNAIDFCPVDRPILHIFVISIRHSLFAHICVVL